jgi:hypothetical protein
MSFPDRSEQLAARVRWLDRYRRALAILIAGIAAPLAIRRLAHLVGADWPELHGLALSVVVGVIAWWVIEVALAGLTAVWETECACLCRDRRVPRAVVVRR